MIVAGKCPKGRGWIRSEARCVYHERRYVKKSLSAAISTCAREGASLVDLHSQTKADKALLFDVAHHLLWSDGTPVWVTNSSAGFKHFFLGHNYRVTLCGGKAGLVHRVDRTANCTIPHDFLCEIEKGTFPRVQVVDSLFVFFGFEGEGYLSNLSL